MATVECPHCAVKWKRDANLERMAGGVIRCGTCFRLAKIFVANPYVPRKDSELLATKKQEGSIP